MLHFPINKTLNSTRPSLLKLHRHHHYSNATKHTSPSCLHEIPRTLATPLIVSIINIIKMLPAESE